MSFGLTIEKLFLIGLVALLIVGPDRLPAYSAQLARLVGDRPWCDGDENRPDTQFGIMRTDEEITTLANKAGWHAHAVRMPAEFFAAEARYDAVLTRREVQSV